LHQGLEEGTASREVKAPQISQGQSHDNGRDEPAVRPGHVASGGHPDHRRELGGGAEHFTQLELSQQQPEHRGADHGPGQTDPHTECKLAQLAAQALVGARRHGMEDQRAEYPAHWVDQ
jgi:hypothetical protein